MTHVPPKRYSRNERNIAGGGGAHAAGADQRAAGANEEAAASDEAEVGKAGGLDAEGAAVKPEAAPGGIEVENPIDLIEPGDAASFDPFDHPADRYYRPSPPARFGRRRSRRNFIGGSDARIIMGGDEDALIRLWKEKRGEVDPEDLSGNLVVQLGHATEVLNRIWYIRNTGMGVSRIQEWVRHPVVRWMAATLDGFVDEIDAVFEAKFMLPWSFSEDAALAKHMAQLQHNMWVTNARSAVLSIITGGGKWIEMTIPADPLYQHFLITAERRFWRCVKTGERPRPYGLEPPAAPVKAVRIVDMEDSNSWAEFAGLFCTTRIAFLDHERAKAELKALMPEDAREASGHGVRARRSKSGAVSFDILNAEGGHATLQ